MTITEQIRLKLKTVDEDLVQAWLTSNQASVREIISKDRRILREICELDGESEE